MERKDIVGSETFIFISGLFVGALVGLTVGILIAPQSGAETRQKIIRRAGKAREQVTEVIDDLEESGREFFNDVKQVPKRIIRRGKARDEASEMAEDLNASGSEA